MTRPRPTAIRAEANLGRRRRNRVGKRGLAGCEFAFCLFVAYGRSLAVLAAGQRIDRRRRFYFSKSVGAAVKHKTNCRTRRAAHYRPRQCHSPRQLRPRLVNGEPSGILLGMSIDTTAAGFTLGRKGLSVATPLASGELIVSGYLTRWAELDREAERMVRGAFAKSIPAFLQGHAPFVYGHRLRDVLGTVLHLEEDDVGVKMVAKVNRQPESSPLRWVYEAIRNRTIRGLSVGAMFKKARRPDGTADVIGADIIECSATASPVLASTGFEVVSEGKALELFAGDARPDFLARIELGLIRAQARELHRRAILDELRALSR